MTTAMQIFTNEDFGEVRIVMRDGEPWFVAADVCRALELDDTSKAVARLDDDEKDTNSIPTPGGKQNMSVISEAGLYALVLSSRKPEAKKFKRWVTHEVIPSIRKTGSYSIESKRSLTTADAIADVRRAADEIQAEFVGVHRSIALLKATSIAEKIHGIPLKELKELLPSAEHNTGFMNPTQIGEKLGGIKPRMVNMLLAEAGLQYKADKNWRLTEAGKAFGEEMPFTRNGHTGWQIRWNGDVLYELEKREESFGQEALSSRVFKEAIIHV